MRVIKREFKDVKRADVFRVIPLGDIHIGAAACSEKLFKNVIKRIEGDPDCYWLGMGDYCEFINRRDKRFDPETLAPWIGVGDLADLALVQREYFLELAEPIAHKCLALLEGNHEILIKRHYERDVYSEIVTGIKAAGGFAPEDQIGMGIYGWLWLSFRKGGEGERGSGRRIAFNLHHGFTGGRLAGAKALNMQRWLWTHEADVVLFGHSHNTGMQLEAVEMLDQDGRVIHKTRRGAYTGTFRKTVNEGSATYAEEKGYFPLPIGGVEVELRPHTKVTNQQIRIICAA